MKQINLLPWREQTRKLQQREFLMGWLSILIITAVILIRCHYWLLERINEQESLNMGLVQQINKLDHQIKKIETIKTSKHDVLMQIQHISDLQLNRSQPSYLFSDLAAIIPQEILLTSMQYDSHQALLKGIATSNTVVASLLHNLESVAWFANAKLQEVNNNQFVITFIFKDTINNA